MSAAEHAARAREEQQVARDHQGMPTVSFSNNCRGGGVPEAGNPICWTANEHRGEAAHHRELAQKHRAAAAALVAAEERMCVGVSEDDRAMSPFYHRADVLRVTPLQTSGDFHGAPAVAGAAVLFRPVPGLTGQSLQHLIDCHLARAAALGHEVPEMPYCPLVLNGVKARVASTDEGLLVELSAEDEATGREILRRSVALLDRGSTPVPSVEGL